MTETTTAEPAADAAPPRDATPHPQATPRDAAWRNGLAAATALLAAALILRGPADVAGLHWSVRALVAALLAAAFALLVRAALTAADRLAAARRPAALGLALLGAAVLVGWLTPAPATLMQLTYDHGVICGQVSLQPDGYITVDPDPGQPANRITAKARTLVPVDSIHGMTEVRLCEVPAAVPTPAP